MSLAAESGFSRILQEGDLSGAFYFFGDAGRLRDEAARRLVDAALDPATRDFNLDVFRGDAVEPEALAAALAMPPMMAERRVVLVTEAQGLTPTGRKVLLEATESPPSELTLVVTATVPSGSKAAFYRDLKARCRSLEWSVPREEELPGWLVERARTRHGARLSREAAQALAGSVGTDLSVLDAELEKLSAAGDGRIDLSRVQELVPRTRRMDRWTWLDLVASRRYERALRELEGVLPGDSAVGLVIGMVDQHLLVANAVEGGVAAVRRALSEAGKGYLQWKAKVYARQAREWTADELERALRLLLRADRRLKTGGDERAVLQELLAGLRLLRKVAA